MSLPALELDPALQQLIDWVVAKCPAPSPHFIKVATLKHYVRLHNCCVFIETGAGSGNTIGELSTLGIECHTIELDTPRYLQVSNRFRNADNVTVHHGDSGVVLPELIRSLKQKALFWLDAHYSWDGLERAEKETPIEAEVLAILEHQIKDHVILIDDVRLFGNPRGELYRDYPPIAKLESLFRNRGLNVEILYDMMRVTPRN